jgi:hypothetical protein
MGISNIERMLVRVYSELMSKFQGQNFYKEGGM